MGIRNMKRKVKFFDKLYDTDTLDEEINAWIEGYNKELIDVRLTVQIGMRKTKRILKSIYSVAFVRLEKSMAIKT